MRRGTTLLEMLLVLALLAVSAGIALPAVRQARDRLLVDEAARLIMQAHARARTLAVAEARVVVLDLTQDSLVARAVEGPADSVARWRTGGPAVLGVTAGGLPRSISFSPGGVAFGVANGTYTLTRGSARRQVVVSRYGRIRLL